MMMDTIKEIIAYARENEAKWNKRIRFTMTTNATLLTDEMMDYMDKELENIILFAVHRVQKLGLFLFFQE